MAKEFQDNAYVDEMLEDKAPDQLVKVYLYQTTNPSESEELWQI